MLRRDCSTSSLNYLRSARSHICLCDAGSPRRDAFPHDVRLEHGAHPVSDLAPEPRRTGAGPRAPTAHRCERRRARQLRLSKLGLNINRRDFYGQQSARHDSVPSSFFLTVWKNVFAVAHKDKTWRMKRSRHIPRWWVSGRLSNCYISSHLAA